MKTCKTCGSWHQYVDPVGLCLGGHGVTPGTFWCPHWKPCPSEPSVVQQPVNEQVEEKEKVPDPGLPPGRGPELPLSGGAPAPEPVPERGAATGDGTVSGAKPKLIYLPLVGLFASVFAMGVLAEPRNPVWLLLLVPVTLFAAILADSRHDV